MGAGANRNELCWCGSGRKLKKCHLDRASEAPVNPWEAEKQLKKLYSAKYCLAPKEWHEDCHEQIVKAHTIPRSGSLSKIARDGKVYTYDNAVSFASLNKNRGRLVPALMGVRQASTFTGFCATHDDAIFAPLEKTDFTGTREQCFLLGYRAFSREMFTKHAQLQAVHLGRNADRGKSADQQMFVQTLSDSMEMGVSAALDDNQELRKLFDHILLTGEMDAVRAYVLELENPPPVMCSGSFYPEQDFKGNHLQDLSDLDTLPHLISVNSFFGGQYGAVVFTWLERDEASCRQFVESLDVIRDDQLAGALTRMMFECFENVSISPEWWEALGPDVQSSLSDRMLQSAIPWNPRSRDCLAPDGVVIPPWRVRARRWIEAV